MIIFRILLLSILFIAFCHFLSLIKRNPISPVLITWGQFTFWKNLFYFPFFILIPSIVPASAHIQIESMSYFIGTQAFYKEFVCHHLLRLDDAEFTILLTQCPVDVPVILHLSANRPDCAILDNQQLAEAHVPSICCSWIICFPHKLPFAITPYKATSIRLAAIAFFHHPVADMVIRNIQMLELIQQLTCKGRLTTKLHIILCSLRHLPTYQVDLRIIRIIHVEIGCRLNVYCKTTDLQKCQSY